jgi:adenylate cyclase
MSISSAAGNRLWRRWPRLLSLLLALLTTFTVVALYYGQNPFLEAFEDKSYDLRFRHLRGPVAPSEAIVIVAIDEKSISELGRFPWSRRHYVPLLQQLSAAGAKAVLFDAFFPEVEDEATDRAFAAAIAAAGNVILATGLELGEALQVTRVTRSLPLLEQAAMGAGHINFLPDEDGVNRRNLLLLDDGERLLPSLGLRGAMVALGVEEVSATAFTVEVGGRSVPVADNFAMWVNYAGPAGIYPRYSFTDILHGRVEASLLKDKLVFIGATALGIYDMRVTPFYNNTPGVETHAAVADNILTGRFIQRTGIEALIDIAVIACIGLLTFFLTARLQLYRAIPVTVLLCSGYLWLAYHAFLGGHWLSIIYPLLAATASLLVSGSLRYLLLERRARQMRTMFSSYLSPKLVARLEREPDAANIGGDSRQVTVVFTDIKGFTAYSESHTPLEVVTRLNEYLGAMVRVISDYDGTVDKFLGDGIMSYWGAPLSQADHAERAVGALLQMKQAMAGLREGWAARGELPFSFRAGVNSGEVIAGNIGSRGKKMEYTVIGDTVNLAARLESTAKFYGVDVLVGDTTYQLTRERFRYRELDRIRVVGKQIPVSIYEPLAADSPLDEAASGQFEAALKLYRAGEWQGAGVLFQGLCDRLPEDGPSQIFVERCAYLQQHPPQGEWDGVFNRRDK